MADALPRGAEAARAAGLPVEVKGLATVSLFNDFASEMMYPVLPAFVTGTLGGSAVSLGALDGAAELTSSLVRWLSGRLADRPRWSKPLIAAGYTTALLVRPVIAAASAAWQVIGIRVIDRVGKGLRAPARDALLSRITPAGLRGRAFGFHRGADHLGAVLGSLTAWVLLSASVEPRSVIGWSIVPGLLAIPVLAVVLRRVRPEAWQAAGAGAHGPAGAVPGSAGVTREPDRAGGPVRDREGAAYWLPMATLVILTAARLPETLLLLRLQHLGVPAASIPLAWAALHVVRSAASYPGGLVADRMGPRWGLVLGSLGFAGVLAALAAATSPWPAVLVFLVHGVGTGLVEPSERLAVTRLAPVRTGRGFGIHHGIAGLLALPLGLGFGSVYAAAGGPAALLASAGVLTLGAMLWLLAAGGRRTSGVEGP